MMTAFRSRTLGTGAAIAFLAACSVSCGRKPDLPVLGHVPPFQLTSQSGETFDSRALAGHVWVANFIFTHCTGPCPMMTAQMRRVQTSTAGGPDLKLVSFSVDPERDTPPVLARFAANFKADHSRWTFLTGDRKMLDSLGRDAFHLNSVDGSLLHSTRFAVVDRQGRIRAYHGSTEDDFLSKILEDIRQLERERS